MKKLTDAQGEILLRLARAAIEGRLGGDAAFPGTDDDELQRSGGTFVTLKKRGQLRGCIGNITPVGPIWDSVQSNAVNAALFDSRFPELHRDELNETVISVSILTPAEELVFKDAEELCAKLRPHIDGVILKKGINSSTFLPQVWEQLPDVEQFLNHLCLKAGLENGCWREGGVDIQVYQVQNFAELVK